ncbi:glutamate--cysteine ligase [Actinoplanes sp. NPDC023936]|uniref:carboxylate-amine ligase n=1 Tax=Actinoplanes sp. NPDC023936 TaxID=3154910 RepID=UPI0033CF0602
MALPAGVWCSSPPGSHGAVLTVGVEEEFLLLDPDTGANAPVAEKVRAALPEQARRQSRAEVRRSMLEMVTGVCTDLRDVRDQLGSLRRAAATAADDAGVRLTAVAATPVSEPDRSVPDDPRYHTMVDRFGPLAQDPALCGMHVHVGVGDRDLAVQVCNHLRIWLPVIQALTGNSPFFEGVDTGHSSWRNVQLRRWFSVAPTPYFRDAREHDRTVDDLIATGIMIDEGMVQWYARLSPRYPTVEIRMGDVCADVDDTVLVTALIRAAVETAITEIRGGRAAPDPRDAVVFGAHWRAARDGLGGDLVDLRDGRARPAWELIAEFAELVDPALRESGDRGVVVDGLSRLRETGSGADRQRRIYRSAGDIRAALEAAATWTRTT